MWPQRHADQIEPEAFIHGLEVGRAAVVVEQGRIGKGSRRRAVAPPEQRHFPEQARRAPAHEVGRGGPPDAAARDAVIARARRGGDRQVAAVGSAFDHRGDRARDAVDRRADVPGWVRVRAVGIGERHREAGPVPCPPVGRASVQRPPQQTGAPPLRPERLGKHEGVKEVAATQNVAGIEVAAAPSLVAGVGVRQHRDEPGPAKRHAAVVGAQLDDRVAPAGEVGPGRAAIRTPVAVILHVRQSGDPGTLRVGRMDPRTIVVGCRIVRAGAAVEHPAVAGERPEPRPRHRPALLRAGHEANGPFRVPPRPRRGVRNVPTGAPLRRRREHRLGLPGDRRDGIGRARTGDADQRAGDEENKPRHQQFAALPADCRARIRVRLSHRRLTGP